VVGFGFSDHPMSRSPDHPIFLRGVGFRQYARFSAFSALAVSPCLGGFAFPISAIPRDVGDSGDHGDVVRRRAIPTICRGEVFAFPITRDSGDSGDSVRFRQSILFYQRSSAVRFCPTDHGDHFFPG
jgi:hypothetical protein